MEVNQMTIELANRLAELRKNKGLSQEELADKLHVSRQAVSKWERGEASPDTDNLIELAKIYGISLDELVGLSESSKTKEENKEGLHVNDDEGNEIHIVDGHVHIKDDEGNEVNIKKGGVFVKEADGAEHKIEHKVDTVEVIFSCIVTSVVVLAYLLLGFLLGLWDKAWVLFFLIIIIPSIFTAIKKRNANKFNFTITVVMTYLTICCWIYDFSNWHPLWVMFFAIPIYHLIMKLIKKLTGKDDVVINDD